MATVLVQCRICKEKFNRLDPNLIEGVDYVKPSNRMYYHKRCYDEYQNSKCDIHATKGDDFWFTALWDFLSKDLRYSFNYVKVSSQWNSFLKKKMTAKGIYFAAKYFYEIKRGDVTKSENGIGIVPHTYEDSCSYWYEREERDKGICAAIEKQILEAANQNIVKVKLNKNKRMTKTAADVLAAIENMEMEEE